MALNGQILGFWLCLEEQCMKRENISQNLLRFVNGEISQEEFKEKIEVIQTVEKDELF